MGFLGRVGIAILSTLRSPKENLLSRTICEQLCLKCLGDRFFSEILTLRPYNWSNFRARNIFDHTIRFAIRFSTKSSGVFFWLSPTVFLKIKEICWKVRKCGFCLYLTLVAYYAPPLGISKFLFLCLIQPICSWFKQKN